MSKIWIFTFMSIDMGKILCIDWHLNLWQSGDQSWTWNVSKSMRHIFSNFGTLHSLAIKKSGINSWWKIKLIFPLDRLIWPGNPCGREFIMYAGLWGGHNRHCRLYFSWICFPAFYRKTIFAIFHWSISGIHNTWPPLRVVVVVVAATIDIAAAVGGGKLRC